MHRKGNIKIAHRRRSAELTANQRAALFVKLRAACYTLKDVADLLKIPLPDAYKLERDHRQEIEIERDFLTLKNLSSNNG